jgi:hypothetical protein
MYIFLSIVGILLSVILIIYREKFGEAIGEAEWMRYVGGVYYFIVLVAFFLFFFSIASLTGTTNIFLAPFLWLLPIGRAPETGF